MTWLEPQRKVESPRHTAHLTPRLPDSLLEAEGHPDQLLVASRIGPRHPSPDRSLASCNINESRYRDISISS